jgi:isopenicillin-N N-acyltransferase like protein
MGVTVVDLGRGAYPALGRAQAAAYGPAACTLLGLRWARLRQALDDSAALRRAVTVARKHLPALRNLDAGQYAERVAFAENAGLEPWQVVAIEMAPDLVAIAGEQPTGPDGCATIYAPLNDGPMLAQTIDMVGDGLEDFARVLRLEPPDGPRAAVLTLAGMAGMAGMNEYGVGVCTAGLRPEDARVGAPWTAVVRRLLRERSALEALKVLHDAEVGCGRSFLIVDTEHVFNLESTGKQKRVTHDDATKPYWHTNHYLHPDLTSLQVGGPERNSVARHAAIGRWLAHLPSDPGALWFGLDRADPARYHTDSEVGPQPRTVATIMFDLRARELYAHAGGTEGSEATMLDLRR